MANLYAMAMAAVHSDGTPYVAIRVGHAEDLQAAELAARKEAVSLFPPKCDFVQHVTDIYVIREQATNPLLTTVRVTRGDYRSCPPVMEAMYFQVLLPKALSAMQQDALLWSRFHACTPERVGSAEWGHFSSPFFTVLKQKPLVFYNKWFPYEKAYERSSDLTDQH